MVGRMPSSATRPGTIVWFRQDLRTDDHPALVRAAEAGPVTCLFILDEAGEGEWPMGGASRWWLHHSLSALGASLQALGARLVLRRGDAATVLCEIARESGATRIVASARHEPAARAQQITVTEALAPLGIEVHFDRGALLHDPAEVRSGAGTSFKVFTPFWKAFLASGFDEVPLRPPTRLVDGGTAIASLDLGALELLPKRPWDGGIRATWTPGEAGAKARWHSFAADAIAGYADGRDRCGRSGTSMLSPHLHFGEISPRRVWHETRKVERAWQQSGADPKEPREGLRVFRAELGWREFAHHVLVHAPQTPLHPLRPEFARFPWSPEPALLRVWQRGMTGYPLVDAGMRQLWTTGWMHNRVRMVVASFLVKHLLQPWTAGARWFWDTLVDADLASNTLGWQWTAGCGADAAPYFRIFNPVLQGEKFDADGAFVRRFVPELARLPDSFVHRPWEATPSMLSAAGVALGVNYPHPIVDHATARQRALDALASLRVEENT